MTLIQLNPIDDHYFISKLLPMFTVSMSFSPHVAAYMMTLIRYGESIVEKSPHNSKKKECLESTHITRIVTELIQKSLHTLDFTLKNIKNTCSNILGFSGKRDGHYSREFCLCFAII